MKIGIAAVPALPQLFGCSAPRLKCGANLPRPNIALCIGGFEWGIFPPSPFHLITSFLVKYVAFTPAKACFALKDYTGRALRKRAFVIRYTAAQQPKSQQAKDFSASLH